MDSLPELVRRNILTHVCGARVLALRGVSRVWRDTADRTHEIRAYGVFIEVKFNNDTILLCRTVRWPVLRHARHAQPMRWLTTEFADDADSAGANCDAGRISLCFPEHTPRTYRLGLFAGRATPLQLLRCRQRRGDNYRLHFVSMPRYAWAITSNWRAGPGPWSRLRSHPEACTAYIILVPGAREGCIRVAGFSCTLHVDPPATFVR